MNEQMKKTEVERGGKTASLQFPSRLVHSVSSPAKSRCLSCVPGSLGGVPGFLGGVPGFWGVP